MLFKCPICVLFIDFPLPPINSLTLIMELLVLRSVVFCLYLIERSCVHTYSLAHDQRSLMFPLLNHLVLCLSIRKGLLVTCHPLKQVNIHALYNLYLQHGSPTLQRVFFFASARIKLISWKPLQKQTSSGVLVPNLK